MSIRRIHEVLLAVMIVMAFVWVMYEQAKWAEDFLMTLPGEQMSRLCEGYGGCGDR
jgi:hypothetical protein